MKRLIGLVLTLGVLLSICSVTVLGAGEYKNWLQSDPRWGNISFSSSDTMSKSGCAITSIAKLMVHSGAVPDDETKFNPGIYVNWLKNNGGFVGTGLIVWANAAGYSDKFSYVGEAALSGDKAAVTATIKSYIDKGNVVVVCVKNGGHYVAVDRVANGTVYIMDSALNGPKELFGYSGIEKIRIYKGPHNGSGNNGSGTVTYDTTIDPVSHQYTITSDNGINLRSGIGTSYGVLTAIPYNTVITVTEIKNGWGKTTYNGKTGWCTLEFAKAAAPSVRGVQITPPTKTNYIVGEGLDIAGMKVTVLYSDGTSKVVTSGYTVSSFDAKKIGEQTLYVSYQTKAASFKVTVAQKPYETGTYVINTPSGVNLRTKAGTDGTVLATVANATRVQVTEVSQNWGKITYGGKTGWICLDYANLVKEQVAPTEILLTPKYPCCLEGESLTPKDFHAVLIYSDGSVEPLDTFTLTVGATENGVVTVTATAEGVKGTAQLQVMTAVMAGDCDFDSAVSANDALQILRKVVGKTSDRFYTEAADVDQDGTITATDALYVLQHVVGKLPSFDAVVSPTDV